MRAFDFDKTTDELVIIDQTKLPFSREYVRISDDEALYKAIKTLALRGAPSIGAGAALGLYACACKYSEIAVDRFTERFLKSVAFVASSRPTARDLFYSCERMLKACRGESVAEILVKLRKEAFAIEDEIVSECRAIGKFGEVLIPQNGTVLTHCNAGALATVEFGTALAPVYEAFAKGKNVRVYSDETRPLLQGARLTCYELCEAGIDTTLICDNMAAGLMAKGLIDLVIVGCDRVAANGDFANKTGTLSLAVNCKYFGVPFYTAMPCSTLDLSIASGKDIVIEERDGSEITDMFYSRSMSHEDVKTYNPAFDVTPHELVAGYITGKGVLKHPTL